MTAVAVYCSSSEQIEGGYVQLAAELGTGIGERGWSLVSGGGRVSMMGAVARSARAAGARTVGVIPQALVDYEVADLEADELVVVDSMRERKRIMDDRADAFVALPGGIGTLEELLEVWTATTLGMHDKPVVLVDAQGFYRPLLAWLSDLIPAGFVRPAALGMLHRVDSAGAALTLLDDLLVAASGGAR